MSPICAAISDGSLATARDTGQQHLELVNLHPGQDEQGMSRSTYIGETGRWALAELMYINTQ